jgi:hypothetical protein
MEEFRLVSPEPSPMNNLAVIEFVPRSTLLTDPVYGIRLVIDDGCSALAIVFDCAPVTVVTALTVPVAIAFVVAIQRLFVASDTAVETPVIDAMVKL